MQATACFHDGVPNPILQEAKFVFHDPIPFHTTNSMFNADSDGRDPTIGRLLRRGEFPPTGFFLGLEHRHTGQEESLESPILRETTAGWQRITREIRHGFIMHPAFIGSTHKEKVTGLIDHEEGFEGVALLRATVILLRLFTVFRPLDRSFSPSLPTRGAVEGPSVSGVASIAANSSAVRAGSSLWSARA